MNVTNSTAVKFTPIELPHEKRVAGDPISRAASPILEASGKQLAEGASHPHPIKAVVDHSEKRGSSVLQKVLELERSSSPAPGAKRNSTENIRKAGTMIVVETGKGPLHLRLPPPKQPVVPKKALENMKERMPQGEFTDEEINHAVDKFEKECGCRWGEVAKQDIKTLKIINRLREFGVLQPIIEQLRKEFPGLDVQDVGSPDLTSDKDLSFVLPPELEHRESEVTARFNELFEVVAGWDQSSAAVFDSNAYTGYHIERFHTPELQEVQRDEHVKMSQVMLYLNAHLHTHKGEESHAWSLYKKEYLAAHDKDQQEVCLKQLHEIEQYCGDLKLELDKKIVELAMNHELRAEGVSKEECESRINEVLSGNIKDIVHSADRIREHHPDFVIRASNLLHREITAKGQEFHLAHWNIKKLLSTTDPKEFQKNYHQAIDGIINITATKLHEAKGQNSMLLKMQISKWQGLRDAKIPYDQAQIEAFCKGNSAGSSSPLAEALIGKFGLASDRLLLEKQKIDMKGRCYAQEMHISQGAFLFVVKDIQGGKPEQRAVNQYQQAANELLGFYYAHQSKREHPSEKMIEVSKYIGPRLMLLLDRTETQAKMLGTKAPVFENKESYRNYFNELLAMRKGKIAPETQKRAIEKFISKHFTVKEHQETHYKALMDCKNQNDVRKYLGEVNVGSGDEVTELVHHFLTVSGEVTVSQRRFLESEIAIQHKIPRTDQGMPDINRINSELTRMVTQLNSWSDSLPSKLA